jgi:hypothetical protein
MEPKTEKKSVFIICSVRKADDATRQGLVAYKQKLETQGYEVHLPHLDTNQSGSGHEICVQNTKANIAASETHVFYDGNSEGSHFDIGVKFVDMYLHPEKLFHVSTYSAADSLNILHLQRIFNEKFGGYSLWFKKLEEMIQKEIIPIAYHPKRLSATDIAHIELGMAFALCTLFPEKRINVIYNGGIMEENGQYIILFERSFGTMIMEWEEYQTKIH